MHRILILACVLGLMLAIATLQLRIVVLEDQFERSVAGWDTALKGWESCRNNLKRLRP